MPGLFQAYLTRVSVELYDLTAQARATTLAHQWGTCCESNLSCKRRRSVWAATRLRDAINRGNKVSVQPAVQVEEALAVGQLLLDYAKCFDRLPHVPLVLLQRRARPSSQWRAHGPGRG